MQFSHCQVNSCQTAVPEIGWCRISLWWLLVFGTLFFLLHIVVQINCLRSLINDRWITGHKTETVKKYLIKLIPSQSYMEPFPACIWYKVIKQTYTSTLVSLWAEFWEETGLWDFGREPETRGPECRWSCLVAKFIRLQSTKQPHQGNYHCAFEHWLN